jgi:hypothetical protein
VGKGKDGSEDHTNKGNVLGLIRDSCLDVSLFVFQGCLPLVLGARGEEREREPFASRLVYLRDSDASLRSAGPNRKPTS